MAEPQMKPEDVFYEVGFTREDILGGALIRSLQLSSENLKMMAGLAQKFGALQNLETDKSEECHARTEP